MPRNRYTKTIRIRERARLRLQEKALTNLCRELRCGGAHTENPLLLADTKERRRNRLEQKTQHKSIYRASAANGTTGQLSPSDRS